MEDFDDVEDDCFEQLSTNLLYDMNSPLDISANYSTDFKEKTIFQSEEICNKFLPYSDELETEADLLLAKIKANLGQSVILKNIKPGCRFWTNMLQKYIIMYDLRFTKEDHILFIKLMYELVTTPNLESSLISIFCYMLQQLLRKNYLISPQELELPWRPLYDLYNSLIALKPMQITTYNHPSSLKNLMESVIYSAKIYFPISATREILNELRPQICPFFTYSMQILTKEFELFIPVQIPPKHHALGHELWFHEFMNLWEVCHSSAQLWGNYLSLLFAKLAYHNIGYINWEPYMPLMFTRFVQSFNLPICYKKLKCSSNCYLKPSYIGLWIASVLGSNSTAQVYLEKFLKTIETYFHPANYGSWLKRLEELFTNILHYIVLRLHRERHKIRKDWESEIPDSHKLTDNDIDTFVNSMMPITLIGIFNKRCSNTFYDALHYLAILRPNVVIPNILDKVYPTLGSDIEPHKFITAMTCMMAISRPLIQGSRFPNKEYKFSEGPFHVLPLLFSSLSGIDPNDPSKCFATFLLITTYVTMIPIVDCSQITAELSEDEKLVCEETSRFEDFVLQFMDKVFTWIDSSAVESVRLENQANGSSKSRSEEMAEFALNRVFVTLLRQTSHSIFLSALNKLRSFIVEHVLETQVAGQLVAVLCRSFSHVNSQETLKALLPFLSMKLLDAIGEGDEVINSEILDDQLLYPLLLLSRLVISKGDALLPHMDTLIKVIDKIIQLHSRKGNILGCFTLNIVMLSLSTVSIVKIDRNLDDPNYPYTKDWGETSNIESTKLSIFIPKEEELSMVQKLFTRYFIPAVTSIENFIKTGDSLSRNQLQITLRVIFNILDGCDQVLPFWNESPLVIKPFESCTEPLKPMIGFTGEITMPDGSNVRLYLVKTMSALQDVMLKTVEDDTQSFILLELIWRSLLLGKMRVSLNSNFRITTNYYINKKIVENEIIGNNGWFPLLILIRVYSQHVIRKLCTTIVFTETHKNILMQVMKLCISRYSKIRRKAQDTVFIALCYYPSAYKVITTEIIEILKKDPTEHHDAYKGVLYLITQKRKTADSLLVKQDWEFIRLLWPAIVLSEPSEKPSVIRLKDNIIALLNQFYTTNIKIDVTESSISIAKSFWDIGIKPSAPQPTESDIQKAIEDLREIEENNLKAYNETSDALLSALVEKNLHWRHRLMAMHFLFTLLHPEQIFPAHVVRFFLGALIHESLKERNIGLRVLMCVFKQLKKNHIKIKVPVEDKPKDISPGCREDNRWLQYSYEARPKNATEWDEQRYIHKCNVGYYVWPSGELELYAPASQQPRFDVNSLSAHDAEIVDFFGKQQNVDKLVEYLSLEGKKGGDKFNCSHLLLFKGLFRNHDDAFLDNFLPHLSRLVADKHQESSQRCAAEIVCGLIRGSKHWPYQMIENMWAKLLPILRAALRNLTVETFGSWANCIANACRDRDPKRQHWLLECLMEELRLGEAEASSLECGRLMILQPAVFLQSWRAGELMGRLLKRLENRIEESPFQNVRDRLASMLVCIFKMNMKFHPTSTNCHLFPEASDFLDRVHSRLESLVQIDDSTTTLASEIEALTLNSEGSSVPESTSVSENTLDVKREKNIRLFKTICRWILETVMISNLDTLSDFYRIYPIMCQLENNEKDEELSKMCTTTIAVLSQTLTLPKHVPAALEAVRIVSESSFWSARASCLQFLQVLVFHNMSILLSNETWISTIQLIVLKLLEDERLEVRGKAAQILGGLLHCTLIPNQELLLEDFKKKANIRIGRKIKKLSTNKEELVNNKKMFDIARTCHAGVLGMCAFIQAHPYDIPKHVPPIFECLSLHLNDPEPIPATIRKTLNNFKRTHCDGWTGLQGLAENFTEEQFAVLQDLTVPPSYYA